MGILKSLDDKSRQFAGKLGTGGMTILVRQNEAIIELLKEIKELIKERNAKN